MCPRRNLSKGMKERIKVIFDANISQREGATIISELSDKFEVISETNRFTIKKRAPEAILILLIFYALSGLKKFIDSFSEESGRVLARKLFEPASRKGIREVITIIKHEGKRIQINARSSDELHKTIVSLKEQV